MPLYPPPSAGGSVATDTIWDAVGDLAVGSGADTAAKLAIGSNTFVLTSNGTTAAWAAAAASGLTVSSNYVTGGDVVMTTSGTFYDGPSLTLSAGSYILIGVLDVVAVTSAARTFEGKLWDGTTTVSYASYSVPGTAAVGQISIPFAGLVAPGGSTTYKLSVKSTVNLDHIQGAAPFDKASYLIAVKYA